MTGIKGEILHWSLVKGSICEACNSLQDPDNCVLYA